MLLQGAAIRRLFVCGSDQADTGIADELELASLRRSRTVTPAARAAGRELPQA